MRAVSSSPPPGCASCLRTVGNSCVHYDMVYLASFCLDILSGATRTVQVRFDAPGTATVRVVGANGTTAERSIIVRPLR